MFKTKQNEEIKGKNPFFLQICFGLSICFVVLTLLSGFGNRMGVWDFKKGFSLMKIGVYGAIFTSLLTAFGIMRAPKGKFKETFVWGIPPLVLCLLLIMIPLRWIWVAKHVPRIHDITTDTVNPPTFVRILSMRENAPNSADYGGVEIAEAQKKGYPDLKPEIIPLDQDHSFQKALQTAKKMGWEIVDANPSERRIEATDTTFWFGFKDDIVIRIVPVMGASRLDIRSLSRVGGSDVGTNAKRIRNYLKKLEEALSTP